MNFNTNNCRPRGSIAHLHNMFIVYCILNCLNGKVYIGKTNNLKKRYLAHLRVAKGGKEKYPKQFFNIHKAIVKYGKNNFEFYEIQKFLYESDSYIAENYWIEFYNSRNNKFGYNIIQGGIGLGSGKNSPNYGLKRSESTILKLKESHLGYKNQNYCKSFSTDTKLKMSKIRKGNYTGENNAHSKLSLKDIIEIRKLYSDGMSLNEIAVLYNVHKTNIFSIVKNKTWTINPCQAVSSKN